MAAQSNFDKPFRFDLFMKRRFKVLHFISDAGQSPYLCDMAEHVNHTEFDFTVASLSPAGTLQEQMKARGIQTFALNYTRRAQYIGATLRLAALLRRKRFDIIQTHLFDASLVGLAAARLAGIPLAIFTGHHSHEIPFHRRLALKWADTLASRWLSHFVVAHCIEMKEMFIREEGVPAAKIKIIPFGFDLARLRPAPTARARIRTELGLNGKRVFGAIGRMYWIKNYPSLFKAFSLIAARVPDVVLLVIGDGPDRERLKRLAAELAVEDRIIFTGHRRDIVDVLSAIDVFVHAALAESFGQVYIEAFALRKPVVSTAVGISREIIENGTNGFLVPLDNSDALREALEEMLRLADKWEQMGADGEKRIQQFAIEKVQPAYEAQYLEWLKPMEKLNGADSH